MKTFFKISCLLCCYLFVNGVQAQLLNFEEKVCVTLSNGTKVILHKKINSFDENSNDYYYLPTALAFSNTNKKDKELSLLSYTTKEGEKGAIFHFLLQWGLTKNELNEVRTALKNEKGSEANFMGPVEVILVHNKEEMQIEGISELVNIMNTSEKTIGKTPMYPFSKLAASFKFKATAAEKISKAIEQKTKELKNTNFSFYFNIQFKKKGVHAPVKTVYVLKQNLFKLLN